MISEGRILVRIILMESRMRGNFHVRFGMGENLEIISKNYLSSQQMLSKKNTFSLNIDKRNLKTGQVTAIDKIDFLMNIEKYKINTMIKVKKLAYDVYKTSDDFLILCNILLYMYDDCIHYKVKNEINYMNDYKEVIDEICSLNNIESLGKKIKIVENVKNELGLNANMKLLFDKLIIELSEV